jgi:hypothetical protein
LFLPVGSGLIPGLLGGIHRLAHIVVKSMRVLGRCGDIGVPQELLNDLEIARRPQNIGRRGVAVVVEAVVDQLGVKLGAPPFRL